MRLSLSFFLAFLFVSIYAQEYSVVIDLNSLTNDKVPVEIICSNIDHGDEVIFQMPKIVPGTYSISDFGRVVSDLHAYDKNAKELEIEKLDVNRWKIKNASDLHRLSYWVEDTFDDMKYRDIFEPGGSTFEEDVFLLNNFGIIGYIDGFEKLKFKINIIHPKELYGIAPMKKEIVSEIEDIYFAENYLQLSDSPIMYSVPDTSSVMIGKTEVVVSVYSPEGVQSAKSMMREVEPTLTAQGEYLGGELPVDKYVILIYFHENSTNSGMMGALEHSYSTVFSYPNRQSNRIAKAIVSTTSHEFFHIITPLTIHSEEIGDYDFINPRMSKHLWMYEGLTEYSSMRVQAMYGLMSPDEFLEEILEKKQNSMNFNDSLPFTELSLGTLGIYEDQYLNVYEKGALIGLSLDLLLLHLSDGEYDIRSLMDDLASKFGVNKSFKDEELFDIITELTYPEVRDFFEKYVEGSDPLPLKEYLNYVGVSYLSGEIIQVNSLGNVGISFDPDKDQIIIQSAGDKNGNARKMGLKDGDILLEMFGQKVGMDNYRMVFQEYFMLEKGADFYMTVARMNRKGKIKNKRLKGKVIQVEAMVGERLIWDESPSYMQQTLRKSWINEHTYN